MIRHTDKCSVTSLHMKKQSIQINYKPLQIKHTAPELPPGAICSSPSGKIPALQRFIGSPHRSVQPSASSSLRSSAHQLGTSLSERLPAEWPHSRPLSWGESRDPVVLVTSRARSSQRVQWCGGMFVRHSVTSHAGISWRLSLRLKECKQNKQPTQTGLRTSILLRCLLNATYQDLWHKIVKQTKFSFWIMRVWSWATWQLPINRKITPLRLAAVQVIKPSLSILADGIQAKL